MSFALLLLLAAATRRWWQALASAFADDLRSAMGEDVEQPPVRVAAVDDGRAPRSLAAPVNRVLAFRGVERRAAARARWQGGFGRRGL